MAKSSLILVLLFSISCLLVAGDQLQFVSPYSSSRQVTSTNPLKITISLEKLIADHDFLISVSEENRNQIKVSLGLDEAAVVGDDYSMKSTGRGDVNIFAPYEKLKGKEQIYAKIECLEKTCNVQVWVDFCREFYLKEPPFSAILSPSDLESSSAAIIRFNIPYIKNLNRIVIHAEAIPTAGVVQDLKFFMYVNQGKEIKAKMIPDAIKSNWYEGKTVVIHKELDEFCTNCDYTVSLKFPKGSVIKFNAFLFEKEVEYQQQIYDAVKQGKANQYIYEIKNEKKGNDIFIRTKPMSGEPTVYIDCDLRPTSRDKYTWNFVMEQSEQITLTEKERKKCRTNKFFIEIYSQENSIYTLSIWSGDHSHSLIDESTVATGRIAPSELLEFEFAVPFESAQEINVNITSKAKLDIKLINCRFPSECPTFDSMSASALPQNAVSSYSDFDYDDLVRGDVRTLKILPCDTCMPMILKNYFGSSETPGCAYRLSIKNKNSKSAEYEIQLDIEGNQWLFPNVQKLGSINGASKNEYVMFVEGDNIQKVIFQITTISGHVKMFARKENERELQSHEGLIAFDTKDMKNIKGTYYINVVSTETSSYRIAGTIITKDNKKIDNSIKLEEGIPQKGVILTRNDVESHIYRMDFNLEDNFQGSIIISTRVVKGGRIVICITEENYIPIPGRCLWTFQESTFKITSQETNFKPKGKYRIGIFADREDPEFFKTKDIIFQLTYSIIEQSNAGKEQNMKHALLSSKFVHSDNITSSQTQYFIFVMLNDDESASVFVKAETSGVVIYGSYDPNNKFPSKKTNNFAFSTLNGDHIHIQNSEVKKLCQQNKDILNGCPVYLTVTTTSKSPVGYSISLFHKKTEAEHNEKVDTLVEEGAQRSFPIQEKTKFYFFPKYNTSTTIIISSDVGNFHIYANRKPHEIGESMVYPSEGKYDFKNNELIQVDFKQKQVLIPADPKHEDTVITFVVEFKSAQEKSPWNPLHPPYFTVLVVSEVIPMLAGNSYVGYIKKNTYQYYSFKVDEDDTLVHITLTALGHADPDIYVSKGNNVRPTSQFSQFFSASKQRTEDLQIDMSDIYPQKSMKGDWVIGVFGRLSGPYNIMVVFGSHKVRELKSEVPIEFLVDEDHELYFKYYHSVASAFDVHLTLQSGELEVYIAKMNDLEDYMEHPPGRKNHLWKLKVSKFDNKVSVAPGVNFCSACTYGIQVVAKKASKYSIMITPQQSQFLLQNALTYHRIAPKESGQFYKFIAEDAPEVILDIVADEPGLEVYASQNSALNHSYYYWQAKSFKGQVSINLKMSHLEFIEKGPKSVWDGKNEVSSSLDSYYIYVRNPLLHSVNFTLGIHSDLTYAVAMADVEYHKSLVKNEPFSFIFYSSEPDGTLEIILDYTLDDKSYPKSKSLPPGLEAVINLWPKNGRTGRNVLIQHIRDDVRVLSRHGKTGTKVKQIIELHSEIGKYEIKLKSTYAQDTLGYSIVVRNTKTKLRRIMGNNWHHVFLESSQEEIAEINIPNKGALYLDVNRCNGDFQVLVGNTWEELENDPKVHEVKEKNDFFGKYMLYNPGKMFIKFKALESGKKKHYDKSLAYLTTAFFSEDRLMEIEKIQPGEIEDIQFIEEDLAVKVKFSSVDTSTLREDKNPKFDMKYHAVVCPQDARAEDNAVCNLRDRYNNCTFGYLNDDGHIDLELPRINTENFIVSMAAVVNHEGHIVRTVPYGSKSIFIPNVNGLLVSDESWYSKLFDWLGMGIVYLMGIALIVGMMYWAYKKYVTKEEPKFSYELPRISTSKSYMGLAADDY